MNHRMHGDPIGDAVEQHRARMDELRVPLPPEPVERWPLWLIIVPNLIGVVLFPILYPIALAVDTWRRWRNR